MTVCLEGKVSARRRIRLSYGGTDVAGTICFAAWFALMERLSTGWFPDSGFRFGRMVEKFGVIMVSRATICGYLARVGTCGEVDAGLRVARVGERSCELVFAMTRVRL
jgi:acyl-CoA thioesterase FadM